MSDFEKTCPLGFLVDSGSVSGFKSMVVWEEGRKRLRQGWAGDIAKVLVYLLVVGGGQLSKVRRREGSFVDTFT